MKRLPLCATMLKQGTGLCPAMPNSATSESEDWQQMRLAKTAEVLKSGGFRPPRLVCGRGKYRERWMTGSAHECMMARMDDGGSSEISSAPGVFQN
ncbi:hypothetical protein Micbo1qcDRAFT_15756 [Microdochium bolleyi]|uniref:Uncharacterized protein n=1 Tax=Microdochium bolleyi TaxID=196109 RepID=A0A136IV76_9PEZI|nr:hypothetical protein Micbo1qcDRAFT_15756 [Microdochium bolleyi]